MSTQRTRDIKSALLEKGFREDKTHHEMFWLYVDGRKTSVRTRLSHGVREYGDGLLGPMAKQLRLRRKQLDDLIECPLTKDSYSELLLKRGEITL